MAQITSQKPNSRTLRRDLPQGVIPQQDGLRFVYIGGRSALRMQIIGFDDRHWHIDFNEGETSRLTDYLIAERTRT